MFVQKRCMDCNAGNCKRNSSESTKVHVKVEHIPSGVAEIPVIDCSECRGRRQCPTCPTRIEIKTSEL